MTLETLTAAQLYAFYGAVTILVLVELILPVRIQDQPVDRRWFTNIALFILALGVQRLLAPAAALVASEMAVQTGRGLLQIVALPAWVAVPLGVLLLDLSKYLEHRVLHAVPVFWRLHVVHHSDTDADFTTTERHHPFEVVLGMAGLFAITYLFGVPPLAVAIYILLAPPVAVFSHANIRLSARVDRYLRWFVVTPSVHTIHHSAARQETDSNFGALLTVWDRIFRTYRTSTPAQDAARIIGLEYFRDARSARLDRVLCMPFLPIGSQQGVNETKTEGETRVLP